MIPVTDAVRARRRPYVNVGIIIACILVFIYELTLNAVQVNDFFRDYGIIARELTGWADSPSVAYEPMTVIGAAFIHAGWLHLAGNMIFLWVFGDNVEDALGHIGYALFYAVSAIGAAALQVGTDVDSVIPMIGASGAIAGVLGGYLVLYPRARVGVIIPVVFFLGVLQIPAMALIVLWFAMQLLAGIAAVGVSEVSEGVAYWAHVGGFVTGLAIMLVLRPFLPRRSLSELAPRRRVRMWR